MYNATCNKYPTRIYFRFLSYLQNKKAIALLS